MIYAVLPSFFGFGLEASGFPGASGNQGDGVASEPSRNPSLEVKKQRAKHGLVADSIAFPQTHDIHKCSAFNCSLRVF